MWPKLRGKSKDGWVSVLRRGECLDVTHVVRPADGRPMLMSFDSYRIERDEADALLRVAQAHKLKSCRCVTLLGENDYRLNTLESPSVPLEERLQAVRWRVKDMLDFPVDSAALAVVDIPGDGARQANLLAVAASAAAIGGTMARFEAAKAPLSAIDIPEMAVRNIAALFEEQNRALAFLAITAGDSLLAITVRGELCMSRRIEMSPESLASANEERRGQLLERLALELQRTLDNFDRQFGFVSVSQLMVASEFDLAAVVAGLAQNLYLPVVPVDLPSVLDISMAPALKNPEAQSGALLAIGAALRSAP